MGTMSPCIAFWVLALGAFLCNAFPSVPVATDPILSTTTVTTVLPSLVTLYSVVPATDAVQTITTITTTINGQETVIATTVPEPVAGSITSTIISTISVTTTQVVLNTVGYSTILGPDPTAGATELTTASNSATTAGAPGLALTTTSGSGITDGSGDSTSSIEGSTSKSSAFATATAVGAGGSSSSSSSSSSTGLSPGAKAGIGVGVAIVVIVLTILSFFLGQRYSRRHNVRARSTYDVPEKPVVSEKDTFHAGPQYELTASQRQPSELRAGKSPQFSMTTTEEGSSSESTGGKSHDMGGGLVVHQQNITGELSALPQFNKDENMYIGVPSHMSGFKRWSMKEYEKD